MPASINFSGDQFRSFMSLMSYMKDSCQDLSIYEGKVHQLNKPRTLLFDIDLTKYFGKNTVYINNIKQQHSLLSLFAVDNNEVKLFFEKGKYVWIDSQSKITYLVPDISMLDPKYLDPENATATNAKAIDLKVFETVMDRTVLKRIGSAAKSLESAVVTLKIDGDHASFVMIPSDLVSETKFEVHTIDSLSNDSYYCDTRYEVSSFLLATEELKLTLYKNSKYNGVFTMKYEAELDKTPITVWAATKYTVNNNG